MRGSTLLLLAVASCMWTPPRPRFVAMLCDRSTSATCDEQGVKVAVLSFLDSRSPPSSLMEVWVSACDLPGTEKVYEVGVPGSWGAGVAARRRKWREEEHARLDTLKLPPLRNCSAIAAGIWKVAQRLRERDGIHRGLWIVSDLREVSPVANLERRVPPVDAFVSALRDADLLADLSGIDSIVACAVHDRPTPHVPRWTPAKSRALHEAWSAAFEAMGAPDVKLVESCPWERNDSPTFVAVP